MKEKEIQKDSEEKEEEWPKYKACMISLESSKCHGGLKLPVKTLHIQYAHTYNKPNMWLRITLLDIC